jgi:hypothetical protein
MIYIECPVCKGTLSTKFQAIICSSNQGHGFIASDDVTLLMKDGFSLMINNRGKFYQFFQMKPYVLICKGEPTFDILTLFNKLKKNILFG